MQKVSMAIRYDGCMLPPGSVISCFWILIERHQRHKAAIAFIYCMWVFQKHLVSFFGKQNHQSDLIKAILMWNLTAILIPKWEAAQTVVAAAAWIFWLCVWGGRLLKTLWSAAISPVNTVVWKMCCYHKWQESAHICERLTKASA